MLTFKYQNSRRRVGIPVIPRRGLSEGDVEYVKACMSAVRLLNGYGSFPLYDPETHERILDWLDNTKPYLSVE